MQGRALRRRLCEGDKKAYEAWRSLLRDAVAIEARYRFASDRGREVFLFEPGVCGIGEG
ncbi:hypothetical protein [Rhodovibrio sodomensis]|uniref:hypothetical protein n=1 Tax=Rhodovibrio sodomensis TaxID=1088 RepID=UPI00190854F2|nr:hypothetical protein [Rhodovibrio sodomensis]